MIRFLWKGLIRDRSRSLLPTIVISIGTFLTVLAYCWMNGVLSDMIWANAAFQTGHVKITTFAFDQEADQLPNDLAITEVDELLKYLTTAHPEMEWNPRIRFGGLLDIPDENGETKSQAPVIGTAINLFDPNSPEGDILNLKEALVSGHLPQKSGEILISDLLAQKFKIQNGQISTLISSSMYGSMVLYNFTIVGTIKFGITAIDRGAILADISDIQYALDMNNSASEILGFSSDRLYRQKVVSEIVTTFNKNNFNKADELSPFMKSLQSQNGLGEMLEMYDGIIGVAIFIFIFLMSIVLWNAGLMGSLRRYGEIGVRLAMGEAKGHVYRSLVTESIFLGLVGSIIGAALGLSLSFYLQVHGVDISGMMKSSSMIMSGVMRAKVSIGSLFIGFIPGFIAPIIGTSLSGIGIYRRQTAQLFKELEV
jgi:putative ABC transport system permease protein